MISQNQSVAFGSHGFQQTWALTPTKNNSFEIMVANTLKELTALLCYWDHFAVSGTQ